MLDLAVFARGLTPQGARPAGPGETGVPLRIGDADLHDGDWIVGDIDGVTVIPRAELEPTVTRAEEIAAAEAACWERIRAGSSLLDQRYQDGSIIRDSFLQPPTPAAAPRLGGRRGAGAVERDGLENRWACKRPVGSNPTPAAGTPGSARTGWFRRASAAASRCPLQFRDSPRAVDDTCRSIRVQLSRRRRRADRDQVNSREISPELVLVDPELGRAARRSRSGAARRIPADGWRSSPRAARQTRKTAAVECRRGSGSSVAAARAAAAPRPRGTASTDRGR